MQLLNDFTTSVARALSEIDPHWRDYPGVVICGTHQPHDVEFLLGVIEEARVNGTPLLGICFGHQLAAIEYARNVVGIKNATSEEFGEGTFVVKKRTEPKIGYHEGESWWSFFEVDPVLEENWTKPENFITVPYHPEYQSMKGKPHPVLVEFLTLCRS